MLGVVDDLAAPPYATAGAGPTQTAKGKGWVLDHVQQRFQGLRRSSTAGELIWSTAIT